MEKMTYTLVFEFKNRQFVVKIAGERPNWILIGEFRPPSRTRSNLGTLIHRMQFTEFKADIQNMLKHFEVDHADENEAISYVLVEMCVAHIQKYSRLVLSDLETYVDEILIILKEFGISNKDLLSLSKGQEIWGHLLDFGMYTFKEYLWMPSPLDPNQLVKLT